MSANSADDYSEGDVVWVPNLVHTQGKGHRPAVVLMVLEDGLYVICGTTTPPPSTVDHEVVQQGTRVFMRMRLSATTYFRSDASSPPMKDVRGVPFDRISAHAGQAPLNLLLTLKKYGNLV